MGLKQTQCIVQKVSIFAQCSVFVSVPLAIKFTQTLKIAIFMFIGFVCLILMCSKFDPNLKLVKNNLYFFNSPEPKDQVNHLFYLYTGNKCGSRNFLKRGWGDKGGGTGGEGVNLLFIHSINTQICTARQIKKEFPYVLFCLFCLVSLLFFLFYEIQNGWGVNSKGVRAATPIPPGSANA